MLTSRFWYAEKMTTDKLSWNKQRWYISTSLKYISPSMFTLGVINYVRCSHYSHLLQCQKRCSEWHLDQAYAATSDDVVWRKLQENIYIDVCHRILSVGLTGTIVSGREVWGLHCGISRTGGRVTVIYLMLGESICVPRMVMRYNHRYFEGVLTACKR
jgi:hypothetical protein